MSAEDRLGHVVTDIDIAFAVESYGNLKKLLNAIGALDGKWMKRARQFRKRSAPHAAAVLDDCVRDLRKVFLDDAIEAGKRKR